MFPIAFIISFFTLVHPEVDSTDHVDVFDASSVTVYAVPELNAEFTGVPSSRMKSVDDLMLNGHAVLIRRAAMAGEPMVRGLRGGQVVVSIDGMKVHSACVDNMDPATAYVELENLNRLELNASAGDMRYGSSSGASLTFRMQDPSFGQPTNARVEASLNANAMQRDVKVSGNTSTDVSAVRAAYTYRAADSFRSGGGATINGSNFEKHNAIASGSWATSDQDKVSVDAIYDLATFIGYPALLMDTRRAEAVIGALTWDHTFDDGVVTSSKLYANSVDHVMDDHSRTDEEVMNRDFMPGMRMPMYGNTFTTGLLSETRWIDESSITNAVIDASYMSATATMDMLPLDSTVAPMMLTNIGDARVTTIGANVSHERMFGNDVSLRLNGRIDVSPRTLLDESSRQILLAYRPSSEIDRTLFAASGAVTANMALGSLQSSVTVSSMVRMPTHLESYGFWLYDPQSNIVAVGDPSLINERANGLELSSSYFGERYEVRLTGAAQLVNNYIGLIPFEGKQDLPNEVPIRTYANIGQATIVNAEASASWNVSESFVVGGSARWTYGQSNQFNDPLPFISPLSGVVRALWQLNRFHIEMRVRAAAEQSRASMVVLPENTTRSWITADLLGSWSVSNGITLAASVLNIFDALYHEHTSINDMPSPGRAFTVSLTSIW